MNNWNQCDFKLREKEAVALLHQSTSIFATLGNIIAKHTPTFRRHSISNINNINSAFVYVEDHNRDINGGNEYSKDIAFHPFYNIEYREVRNKPNSQLYQSVVPRG